MLHRTKIVLQYQGIPSRTGVLAGLTCEGIRKDGKTNLNCGKAWCETAFGNTFICYSYTSDDLDTTCVSKENLIKWLADVNGLKTIDLVIRE